jgi:hypothetical protein
VRLSFPLSILTPKAAERSDGDDEARKRAVGDI